MRSVCCRHVRLAKIAPHRDRIRNGMNISVFVVGKTCIMRIMPYPPSFNKIAASTIDPAIGASTWAFGSHRCRPYTGIFARNAVRQASQSSRFVQWLAVFIVMNRRVGVFDVLFMKRIAINRGIEVVRVYMMK